MTTDSFEEEVKRALYKHAEMTEVFLIHQAVQHVERNAEGEIVLNTAARLQLKTNQEAVEEYKQRVKATIRKMRDEANASETGLFNKISAFDLLQELGL